MGAYTDREMDDCCLSVCLPGCLALPGFHESGDNGALGREENSHEC